MANLLLREIFLQEVSTGQRQSVHEVTCQKNRQLKILDVGYTSTVQTA